MLNIAICDDNKPHLEKIESEIKKNLDSQGIDSYIIDTYLSGRELCHPAALLNKYDVVFLDINMLTLAILKELSD